MTGKSQLTNEEWSRIIRAVRDEDGPGFQISKKQMEIILREGGNFATES